MISKEKTTFTFVIPKELKARFDARAKEEDRSSANLLVKLIKNYLDGNSSPQLKQGDSLPSPLEKFQSMSV